MQIAITTRHGSLGPDARNYLREKAEKLPHYFGRLMGVQVEVEQQKHSWLVALQVSAEHKHDFVAREEAATPEAAMDQCLHKVEGQLRRYKERIQNHRGDPAQGEIPLAPPDRSEPEPEPELEPA